MPSLTEAASPVMAGNGSAADELPEPSADPEEAALLPDPEEAALLPAAEVAAPPADVAAPIALLATLPAADVAEEAVLPPDPQAVTTRPVANSPAMSFRW